MSFMTPTLRKTRTAPDRSWLRRIIALGVMVGLMGSLLMTLFSSSAFAEGPSDDADNFSLYKLASNASAYFGNENAPGSDGGGGAENLDDKWTKVTENSGDAGSMLGYADSSFSFSMEWLFSSVSGSSQTMSYDTFKATDGDGQGIGTYNGLMDYVHFGAANNSLGFDSMSGNVMGNIVNAIGGSIVWFLYVVALGVSWLFFAVIQILKFFNPFLLFEKGVAAIGSANGNNQGSVSQEWADGMTTDSDGNAQTTWFTGLADWVSGWYGVLQDISWGALVPLFIGFTIIALVLFKKMDRGSMLKKLMVRIVFIAVGLPLIGGMYTSILSQFDDELGQHAGPTRVVLSTYVDFNSWMTNDRLAIPAEAEISWDANEGSAQAKAMLSARSSALAINKQSNSAFSGVEDSALSGDAEGSWTNATPKVDTPGFCAPGETCDDVETDANAVGATLGVLGRYISSQSVSASDFESGIKSTITQLPSDVADSDTKAEWFIGDKAYGDSKEFGEQDGPKPVDHPLISTAPESGLYVSDNPGGVKKTFKSQNGAGCGYRVVNGDGAPAACNLSPLAAYNYLNTGFTPTEFTAYSSNKATSGFTRESHMSVSQVGTGPASFMYWSNTVVLLGSIVLIGIFYAVGMLVASIKRTVQVIAAIPFATLGAISAISKVIIYSVALIMEVILTLFLYQFVSEFLISLPSIIEGPIASLVSNSSSLFSNSILGTAAVVVMTMFSTILIIAVTFVLLKVRKTVLEAVNEMVTKLIDKFMDTNTPPPAGGGGPGLMSQAAGGLGAGAGMAASNAMMNKFRGGKGGGPKAPQAGNKGPNQTAPNGSSSNVSGTNGPALAGRGPQGELPAGSDGPDQVGPDGGGPNGPVPVGGGGGQHALTAGNSSAGSSGNDGNGGTGGGNGGAGNNGTSGSHGSNGRGQKGADGSQQALPAGKSGAGQLALPMGRSAQDKAVAQKVGAQGGLSRLGVNTSGTSQKQLAGSRSAGAAGANGSAVNGTEGSHGTDGTQGSGGVHGVHGSGGSAGSNAGQGNSQGGSQDSKRAALGLKGASQHGASKNSPSNLGGTNSNSTSSSNTAASGGSKQLPGQTSGSAAQGAPGAPGAKNAQGTPTGASAPRMRGTTQGATSVSGTNAASATASKNKVAGGNPAGNVSGTAGNVQGAAGKTTAGKPVAGKSVAGKSTPGAATTPRATAGTSGTAGAAGTAGKPVAGTTGVGGKRVAGTAGTPGTTRSTSTPGASSKAAGTTGKATAAKPGVAPQAGAPKQVGQTMPGTSPRRAAAAANGVDKNGRNASVAAPAAQPQAGVSRPAASNGGAQHDYRVTSSEKGAPEGVTPIANKSQPASQPARQVKPAVDPQVRKPVSQDTPSGRRAVNESTKASSAAGSTRKSATSATEARQQVGNQPNRSVATGQQPVKPVVGKAPAANVAPRQATAPVMPAQTVRGTAGQTVPAGPGNLGTRQEFVDRMGGQKALDTHAKARGMNTGEYMAGKGPFLDDVNPKAARDVNAAGGTKAYMQQQRSAGGNAPKGETAQPVSRKQARQAERFREASPKIKPVATGKTERPTSDSDSSES